MSATPHRLPWTIDEACGTLRLAGQQTELRLRASLADEAFRSHTLAREFVPLTVRQGRRTVVIVHFYTTRADLMPTNLRQPRIGAGEAFHYQDDSIILVWRCNLLAQYRAADPAHDGNLRALWDAFEALLHRQFPTTQQMLTPTWNRPYDQTRWEAFVRQRGYTRSSPAGIPGSALIRDTQG